MPKKKPWPDRHFFAGEELGVFKLQETFVRFEKAFDESGAADIVIVNALSKTRTEDLLRLADTHRLHFATIRRAHPANYNRSLAKRLKNQSSHGAKPGTALALDFWHTSIFSGANRWLMLYLSS